MLCRQKRTPAICIAGVWPGCSALVAGDVVAVPDPVHVALLGRTAGRGGLAGGLVEHGGVGLDGAVAGGGLVPDVGHAFPPGKWESAMAEATMLARVPTWLKGQFQPRYEV